MAEKKGSEKREFCSFRFQIRARFVFAIIPPSFFGSENSFVCSRRTLRDTERQQSKSPSPVIKIFREKQRGCDLRVRAFFAPEARENLLFVRKAHKNESPDHKTRRKVVSVTKNSLFCGQNNRTSSLIQHKRVLC